MHHAGVIENPLELITRPLLGWLLWVRRMIPQEWFNSGAGQRPLRRENICTTILGNPASNLHWREELQVELPWREGPPLVERAWACLAASGAETHAEALRNCPELPDIPLHCDVTRLLQQPPPALGVNADSPAKKDGQLRWFEIPDTEFLRRALILGCCNDYFYDPAKPVIWTEKRLARRVRLFQTGGFYDDEDQ